MAWWLILIIIFLSLMFLLITRLPIAFCFLTFNIVAAYFLWGGNIGLNGLVLSIFSSVTLFSLLPVPLFILMGEVLFHSGIVFKAIDVLDKWMGRISGRLALVAVASGAILSTLSGSSMGTTAMLGSILTPEMERRGYKKPLSLGPIMGSGGLAIMIPPSALAVVLASLAQISVGQLLMAGVFPGLLMAFLYGSYIVLRATLQPSVAPSYAPAPASLSEKVVSTVRYVLPLGSIIFVVIGLIFLGVTTPTESAAMGGLACYILTAFYGRLSWDLLRKSVTGTIQITVMMFMILTGAVAFSEILAYTGASRGLTQYVSSLSLTPVMLIIFMQLVILFLGTFMEQISIMMITFPIFMPIIRTIGFNPLLFGLLVLLSLEISLTTPPFGFLLFVMKGIAPRGTTMGDIYRAAFPFILCDLVAMLLIMIFPSIALWLPGHVR